jgi:signal transduction histidine kinase
MMHFSWTETQNSTLLSRAPSAVFSIHAERFSVCDELRDGRYAQLIDARTGPRLKKECITRIIDRAASHTASIAHEVNQPPGAILTSGETAIRWLDRPEPDLREVRALAARTVSDAKRAGDVIRRIRSMASHREPELVELAFNDVVKEVMLFLGPELKRQAVQATLNLAPGLPSVRGDRVQLQ